MPFGISPAPEVFQKRLEQLLAGLHGVFNIHDDIIVFGEGHTLQQADANHDERLLALLNRCKEKNVVLNRAETKFIYKTQQLPYMGHLFTADGLKADPSKIAAIQQMPQPEDVASVRRFLGMANYMSKFVLNLAEIGTPLRELVKSDTWNWSRDCAKAWTDIQQAILCSGVLHYFDPKEVTTLPCDASSTGLGAVIMQQGQPVAFASRALTRTERNYCQLEKEMLALVFGVHRFHQYIYGLPVILETDPQPLQAIMKKPVHAAPRRLQRMMLDLQHYSVTVQYKRGVEMYLADTLSRAFMTSTSPAV